MYSSSRHKPKEPEVNEFKTCSMEVWNTGNQQTRNQQVSNQREAPSSIDLIRARLTEEFQRIQAYNFMEYTRKLEELSGNSAGVEIGGYKLMQSSSKIEGLPPGRPQLTRSNQLYGDYLREKGINLNSGAAASDPRGNRDKGSRQRCDNGWNDDSKPSNKVDDGWGDDSAPTQKAAPIKSNDDCGEDSKPEKSNNDGWNNAPVKNKPKNDWSDDEKSSSTTGYNGTYSRENGGGFAGREGSRDNFHSRGRFNRDRGGRGGGRSFQSKEGEWNCSKCNVNNFGHRRECFRCHEPKAGCENEERSYNNRRGGGRGGYRGSRKDSRPARSGGFEPKTVSSGWSDDENEKKDSPKASKKRPAEDNWNDEPVKKVGGGDDWNEKPAAKKPCTADDDIPGASLIKPAANSIDDLDASGTSKASQSVNKICDEEDGLKVKTKAALKQTDDWGVDSSTKAVKSKSKAKLDDEEW